MLAGLFGFTLIVDFGLGLSFGLGLGLLGLDISTVINNLRGKSTGDILPKGRFVCKNDNIILVDGENSGEVFTVPCDGYMGSTFKQLWVSSSICLRYVLYFILLYKDILRNSKKGAAIPHLNRDIFNNLIIGIPPLAEQKRIVAKIEQLLAEIDKLKA